MPADGHSPHLRLMLETLPDDIPVVVVWTNPKRDPEPWLRKLAEVVIDLTPLSIQQWWLTGIGHASTDIVVVANDDLKWARDTSSDMASMDGRTLSMVTGHGGPKTRTGWLWGLDRRHGVAPDPEYRWWAGDDQLLYDAQHHGQGVRWVTTFVQHLKFRRDERPEIQPIIRKDLQTWYDRHHGTSSRQLRGARSGRRS